MKKQKNTADEIKRVQGELDALQKRVEADSQGVYDDSDNAKRDELREQLGGLKATLASEEAADAEARTKHQESVKAFIDKIDKFAADKKLTDEDDPAAKARFASKIREFLTPRMEDGALIKVPTEKEAAKMLEQAGAFAAEKPAKSALDDILPSNAKGGESVIGKETETGDADDLLAKIRAGLDSDDVVMDVGESERMLQQKTGMTHTGHLAKEVSDFHKQARAA